MYPDAVEDISTDMPVPKRRIATVTADVDTDHVCDTV